MNAELPIEHLTSNTYRAAEFRPVGSSGGCVHSPHENRAAAQSYNAPNSLQLYKYSTSRVSSSRTRLMNFPLRAYQSKLQIPTRHVASKQQQIPLLEVPLGIAMVTKPKVRPTELLAEPLQECQQARTKPQRRPLRHDRAILCGWWLHVL